MGTDDEIAERLLRWEERWEHGEDTPAADLCADRPDLAARLQQRIDRLRKMAWMAGEDACDEGTGRPVADALLGSALGDRYRLDAVVGEGGFGRVYRAFDLELRRQVAVKVARAGRTTPEGQGDLLDEARRAAHLRHPGIVPVHDVGRDGETTFVVTDYIDGSSLADLSAEARPSPQDAARLVASVADALHHAHEQGFVHRDIKPANVLIDPTGRPLLTDFGLAASAEQVSRGIAAASGTLPYMAPEQIAGEVQLVGPRSDVYALGVVLYELLTGRLPHQGRTPTALREQALFRPPVAVRSINPAVSSDLEQACHRCLAKHPADRFGDAAELARTLRSLPARGGRRVPRRLLLMGVLLTGTFCVGVLLGRSTAPYRTERPLADEKAREEGVLVFDGSNRVVTPLERFAPCTLEAWVQPRFYPNKDCQFVIGSDIPTRHGIGMGMCEAVLSVEYVAGTFHSEGAIPLGRWSHIAAVFAEHETRLYLNGKQVGTGPATKPTGGTVFVIGNVGRDNPINHFVGKVRSVRISTGERYMADFTPDETFAKDTGDGRVRAVLMYDGTSVGEDRVIDHSGAGNHGKWECQRP